MNKKMLKAKMVEKDLSATEMAKALGIQVSTFYNKMSGKSEFTFSEVRKMACVLMLTKREFIEIFCD